MTSDEYWVQSEATQERAMNDNSDWLDGMLYYAGWGIVIGAIVGALSNALIYFVGIFESWGTVLFHIVLPAGFIGGLSGGILGLPLGIVHKLLFQMRRKAKYKTPILAIATIYVYILSLSGSLLIFEVSIGRYNLYGSWVATTLGVLSGVVAAIAATSFFVYSVRKQLRVSIHGRDDGRAGSAGKESNE